MHIPYFPDHKTHPFPLGKILYKSVLHLVVQGYININFKLTRDFCVHWLDSSGYHMTHPWWETNFIVPYTSCETACSDNLLKINLFS
jgi:hypothetical protein